MGNVWYFVYLNGKSDARSLTRQKRPADVSVGRFVVFRENDFLSCEDASSLRIFAFYNYMQVFI